MTEIPLYDAEHFRQFTKHDNKILIKLEQEAKKEDIPIVGPLVGKMLWTVTKLMKAERVLELGTATGYSAIWMAEALKDTGGKLTTIEWDSETAKRAEENIQEAGLGDIIDVLQGDAVDIISSFEPDHFDLIFQDVEKEMYMDLLDPCVRVLRKGGLIFFDNTAFTTAGDFLQKSLEHPQLDGFHLYAFLPDHEPDWDALTILVKV